MPHVETERKRATEHVKTAVLETLAVLMINKLIPKLVTVKHAVSIRNIEMLFSSRHRTSIKLIQP